MGKNPITKTIRLVNDRKSRYSLKLRTDGTADYIYEDEDEYEIEKKLKYTWDEETNTIRMKLEKMAFYEEDEQELLTYDESLSKIKEECTVENMRQSFKNSYNKKKDKDWFKDDYPDCNSYEDYETAFLKEIGYKSFDDYVKYYKQQSENYCKAQFGAQVTYSYKSTNDEMTLTEKFTGVKNLLNSECEFYDGSNGSEAYIDSYSAYICIDENDVSYAYYGIPDTDKETIDFEKKKRSDKNYETVGNVNGSYTEDISGKTVTINCDGEKYVCEFEGQKFVQE